MTMKRVALHAGHVVLGLAAVVLFAAVFGWVVMTAWNAAIPDLLHLPVLGYEQAVAVLILIRILTGRFTHGAGRCGIGRRRWHRDTAADGAAFYTAWWDAEGADAFKDYVARQTGDAGRA
ncbi:hypothetical protein [Telmatospirillum sp.]|uniref:hypothetical protein n=1 Tax=Telmatospirillum sp. TaxID=2079197 RepID=UPI00284122BD|nr:hypothetical protein [Telmatospirillum sp.]MDR3437606.1 hypothetical protein [Telmatospirillum sp.]